MLAVLVRQVDRVADVEHARGHIGALDIAPQAHELEGLVAAHGAGEQADHGLAAADDLGQHLEALAAVERVGHVGTGVQIQLVDPFPGFARQHFAEGAGVLARVAHAGEDRRRVAFILDEEAHHRGLAGVVVMLVESLVQAHYFQQVFPTEAGAARHVHQHHGGGVDEARSVFGALEIARHPVEVLGDAG